MDNNLINILTKDYTISLNSLANNLRQHIYVINRLNLSNNIRINLIKSVTTKYNNNVKKIQNKYDNEKNKLIQLNYLISSSTKNKQALLIGINYIGTSNQLSGCINDTNNIKDFLKSKCNYNSFNILTDNTNKKPTKQNIINELTNLLVNANSGDNIFFLYSGHGTWTIDLSKDETDGRDEMIVPLDAIDTNTCILDDEINKIINKNLKKNVKLFMIFDSCFSGTVVDLKYNYLTGLQSNSNSPIINPKGFDTSDQVIMISGCKDNQTSADAYVNYLGSNINAGAMTYSFLKTFQDLGVNISLKTLLTNMRSILKKERYSQIPQLSSGTNININNLLLL